VFAGPVGKDVVSRAWRKVKGDWDAWNVRPLGQEPIVRLILDGTVARVRLDRKATSISLLVALGVRADGQPFDRLRSAVGDQEHGRGERGGLAHAARRSRSARAKDPGSRHRRIAQA
jgi:transposase-like protein